MTPRKQNKTFYLFFGGTLYLFCCFVALHMNKVATGVEGENPLTLVVAALDHLQMSPFAFLPLTKRAFEYIFILTGAFVVITLWLKIESERNARTAPGKESGSAGWNNDLAKYNKKYSDPPKSPKSNGEKNMILSNDVFLSMNTWQTKRNNNVMVVGGSGSGKSRFMVKPNLLQANCSYVTTDPSGELLDTTASFLEMQGYKIKVFNLVDMAHSNCYNPFNYIRDDLGVLMLINCLIKNTNPAGASKGDPFWEKSETALLQALVFYLIKFRPKEEQNFTSVMKLLRAAEINENDPDAKSPLDRIFDDVAKKDPTSIALKQYQTFKMGAGKTLKSILISCSVRLTVFNMEQIENLTATDNIDLGTLGDEKQALFVVIPAADDTYNFLVSMMYSQLFETLYYHAENDFADKKLPVHVRFLLDEFANIGTIPEFCKKLATMRKYEISCTIILQNLAQIKAMYKDDWEGLIGNCDSFLFLGGQEFSTLEYISKELGDATIVIRNNSRSMGGKGSSSLSYNRSARKLMNPDEIMRMPENECILIIRGLRPFYGKKFDYTKHKNYKFTGDADSSHKYPYREKFDNTKKLTIEEIKVEAKKQDAMEVQHAIENNLVEKKIIGDVKPIDKNFLKATDIKTPEEADKRIKLAEPNPEEVEEWMFNSF